MAGYEIDLEELDLNEVFPTYAYYYNFVKNNYNSNYRSPYISLNTRLYELYNALNRSMNENNGCCCRISNLDFIDLGRYLYYLKEKFNYNEINIVYGCTYFIYMLIHVLINTGCNKQEVIKSYGDVIQKLKNQKLPPNYKQLDICNHIFDKNNNDIINNIKEREAHDIIDLFRYMVILYQNIIQIHSRYWNYSYRKTYYDTYKKILDNKNVWGKHGVQLVREEFKKEYERYRTCYDCYNREYILTLPSPDEKKQVILVKQEEPKTRVEEKPKQSEIKESPKIIQIEKGRTKPLTLTQIKNGEIEKITLSEAIKLEIEDTSIVSGSSTTFLIFAILIIILILYKIRKLRKSFNRKNKEHVDLMKSFDRMYNDSYDYRCNVAYNAEDYY
ncbi:variable surface protein [Plasmodium gonderi]|uniref:Variable surface protein n=1 Tax=Plasmodium gonderi TaxID=77519 RepID=A0A1Y1JN72_PLAGO|nr:variable surface protein [Plasmodium gonderi]GAW84046.1 variable surface protein [Plasmodium gonderi]